MQRYFLIILSIIFFPSLVLASESTAASPYIGQWVSILPALVAIGLAIAIRQVYIALFLGIWLGAWLVDGLTLSTLFDSLLTTVDTYIVEALVPADGDSEHLKIALFTLITGGMIGVVTRNGGMRGMVQWLIRFATTRRAGNLSGMGLGGLIFFDDYSNTMIVGNTMRPLFDRLRISRERLAFIVDATAAPLATVAIITTWNGFQLSLVKDVLPSLPALGVSGYEMLVAAVGYMLYPLLMLWFVFLSSWMRRDFGPMLTAERNVKTEEHAHVGGEVEISAMTQHEEPIKAYLLNALLPILTLVVGTVSGLFITGEGDSIRDILGSADPITAMLWASLLSLIVAIGMTQLTRSLSLSKTMEAMEEGMLPMLMAVIVLTLAWAIADVNSALGTADFIVGQIGESISPQMLPMLIFLIAAATAFATGTSWGTMGILVPVVLPLAVTAMQADNSFAPEHYAYLYASLASVLAGAVWGDHCSPISDTTILSSIASRCDHIQHVRTQMPYALSVGGIALVMLGAGMLFSLPFWLPILLGMVCVWVLLKWVGQER